MPYKFEQLEVWQLSMDYIDAIYTLTEELPRSDEYNLKSQMVRAATSISLNIAEGSTGQTNAEQARFLAMAIRSLVETVACQHLIRRRNYLSDTALLDQVYENSQTLARKLQSFRKSLLSASQKLREDPALYTIDNIEDI